ncbi:uncharacterized protein LOC118712059 [Pipistrellus kuhlii]|uniref:Uncharacterized protein n=1 Tax=Pipistrellus kuhlii TaxID=59472 RepID=A0A7J7RDH6_PIPKU|nr:uncharacterized protein LOC118712059 [Pipistrellus kuhlii]KAF6274067.1 hypothetical protein mPipKuh1_001797 [Pipistrellus kuhlii]
MRNVIKVPPQKWTVPSMRHDTCFGPTPNLFFSSGKFRALDAHVQQWAQKKRWQYWRSLREPGAQYLLSWQHPCWDSHAPSETNFCNTCFSSTRMLPQDSSWGLWQVPWCLSDEHPHLIRKPPLPDLDMYHQRMEQPLVHPQKELVPLEPIVTTGSHPTTMTLTSALPPLPSSQRLQFCSGEFLPFPFNQQVGLPTWKSLDCPQESWTPGSENPILSRADNRETQAPEWAKQRESSLEDAWEMEVSTNFGLKNNAETKVLEGKGQRLLTSGTGGENLTAGWEHWDLMRVENRAQTQEPGKARGEILPETQAHKVENQEESRYKIDAETQTQGLGKQDQTGSENHDESQVPQRGTQDQIGGDTGAVIQAEGRRNKNHVGVENVVQTQTCGRENLGEAKQEDGVEIQALGWGEQECDESGNVIEIQTPVWGKQDQGQSEKARGEIQKQLRHELQVGGSGQGLRRGEVAGETQPSKKKKVREIRGEDWIMIQVVWWEDQIPVASEIDREFETPYWENRGQIGAERRTEMQAPKKGDQRKDREEDGINTPAPEVENQGQIRDETHVDIHPPVGRNREQFGDETSIDIQLPEMENMRGNKGEDNKETQELGEENQGQFCNEINGKCHTPKWKNQEHIKTKDAANAQASDAQNWGELTNNIDGETHSAEWRKEEQSGGENGMETQTPEKRNQREPGCAETQGPETENLEQLGHEIGENPSSGRRNWEQSGGKNDANNQTLEKRNQREVASEDGRKIQRLRGMNQRWLKSKASGKTCTSECKNLEQIGEENGAEMQIQGKRSPGGTTGGDGRGTQTQSGSHIDGTIQTPGEEKLKKGGDEDAAEIWDAGSQRKGRAEDAGEPRVPRGVIQDQVRERDAAKGNLRVDCYGDEGLPVLTGSGYGALDQEQIVASATCPEMMSLPHQAELFLLSSGEGKHLASQNMDPARMHRVGISPAPLQAPAKPPRSRQRDKRVDVSLAWQLQNPQSLPVSLNLPSSCPPDSCGQAPQDATALVGVPTALTVLPKGPVLTKSQELLLEALLLRRIEHLKWGFPQRVLESYLLFNLTDPCPLPLPGVQLPGLHTAWELQQQQERLCEAPGSRPGLRFPEQSQRVQPPARKSSKPSPQARALESCEPPGSEPKGIAIHLAKPWSVSPPEGSRERQAVREEAPPRAELPAPRSPRPAADQPGSGTSQESVGGPSSENSRNRKTLGPGVSRMPERAPSRVRTSCSRAGREHWGKQSTCQEASQHPRLQCQPPTPPRGESLEGTGPEPQSSPCSKDTSSLPSATRSLSINCLSETPWAPHLAKPQLSAPNLNRRGADPAPLPKVGDPHGRENSLGGHASPKTDLQSPGRCCAGAALPKTESLQGQGEPGNPNRALRNPAASKKLDFVRHVRCFLSLHRFRK